MASGGTTWCEICRDHFHGSHWDEDYKHRRGVEWGPAGYELAVIDAAERYVDGDGEALKELTALVREWRSTT